MSPARFLGTRTALYILADERLALLAGHSRESGFADGKGDEARFVALAASTSMG